MGIREILDRGLRARRDDSGYAMAITMGIVLLLTLLGLALLANVDNALNNSQRVERDGKAFQIASAGLAAALTDMQYNGYQASHFPMNGSMDGGTYRVTIDSLGNTEFKVTSVGTYQTRTSTVREKFFYLNLWAMDVVAGSQESLVSGSSGLHGNTSVYGPLYLRGSVTFPSNSQLSLGPLFIRDGDIGITGSGSIGTSSKPVDVYVTGSHPAAGANGWFVNRLSTSVPVITLPVLTDSDLTAAYNKAKAESVDNIMGTPGKSGSANHEAVANNPATYTTIQPPNVSWTRLKAPGSSSYYKVVGTDAGHDPLQAGLHPLTIQYGTAFGSYFGDGHTLTSGEHDDFAYDGNGHLYVEGTVYIDGNLTINGDTYYVGNGTLVVNGNLVINGKFIPQGGTLQASSALGFAVTGDVSLNCGGGNVSSPTDATPADISGAIFSNGTINLNNHFVFRGSLMAGGISFNSNNSHLMTNPLLPTFLPDSLPGVGNVIWAASAWGRQ